MMTKKSRGDSNGAGDNRDLGGLPEPDGASQLLRRSLRGMSYQQGSLLLKPSGDSAGREPDPLTIARSGVEGSPSGLQDAERISASLGADLSGVQAYTGTQASAACARLGAQAYTVGNRIAFAETNPSLQLQAHEATHVVQQSHGVSLQGGVGKAGDSYEREADAAADRVVAGERVASMTGPVQARDDGLVQRQESDQATEADVFSFMPLYYGELNGVIVIATDDSGFPEWLSVGATVLINDEFPCEIVEHDVAHGNHAAYGETAATEEQVGEHGYVTPGGAVQAVENKETTGPSTDEDAEEKQQPEEGWTAREKAWFLAAQALECAAASMEHSNFELAKAGVEELRGKFSKNNAFEDQNTLGFFWKFAGTGQVPSGMESNQTLNDKWGKVDKSEFIGRPILAIPVMSSIEAVQYCAFMSLYDNAVDGALVGAISGLPAFQDAVGKLRGLRGKYQEPSDVPAVEIQAALAGS